MALTEEEKKQKRSEAAKKAAETRRQNKLAEKNKRGNNVPIWVMILLLGLAVVSFGLLLFGNTGIIPALTPSTPTLEPTEEATEPAEITPTLEPTEEVTEPAEITPTLEPTEEVVEPAEITPTPEPVDSGKIFVDGQETGVILDDGTVAITNGRILCNHDAPYDTDELAIVKSTWVDYQIQTQKGEFAVVFGYGIKVGDTIYSPGAIILVASNGETAEISILNGEVIIWNDISKMHSDIENRIYDEIKNGNMTIKGPLAFKYVSQEFRGYIPQELFDTQIEIVPTH